MIGTGGEDEARNRLDLVSEVMEANCSKCGTGSACVDRCPLGSEIYGDDTECDCCENCRGVCADEV